MIAQRLLKLADFLETVPRKAFYIGRWVKSEKSRREGRHPGECGFSGCAVGWAAHGRLFRGLRLERSPIGGLYPTYEGSSATGAINRLFQIDETDSLYLFFDQSYIEQKYNPTPKQVAKRIRKFVKNTSEAK